MKKLLWLDDRRNPSDGNWIEIYSPIATPFEYIWIKSYREFVDWIEKNGLPDAISFDHDLGKELSLNAIKNGMSKKDARKLKQEEKTGYDCAKWLVNYCIDNNTKLPIWGVHSANPVGKDNINGLLNSFIKFDNMK